MDRLRLMNHGRLKHSRSRFCFTKRVNSHGLYGLMYLLSTSRCTPALRKPERTAYNRQWLSALEELLDELSLTGTDERGAYKEDWRRSYLETERGDAVEFQKNLPDTLIMITAGHNRGRYSSAHLRQKALRAEDFSF